MISSGKRMQTKQSNIPTPLSRSSNRRRKMRFQVKAEKGSSVFLAGSFNNWDPNAITLKQNGDGLYSTSVSLPPGRHEYKFIINGAWRNDEQCQQLASNSYGSHNNVIEVT